MKEELIQTWLR